MQYGKQGLARAGLTVKDLGGCDTQRSLEELRETFSSKLGTAASHTVSAVGMSGTLSYSKAVRAYYRFPQ